MSTTQTILDGGDDDLSQRNEALAILLPLLIVLSTLLFLLLLFLVCILLLRRRRAIVLRDNEGPVDLSREDVVEGDGGFDTIESRWLESVNEQERASYRRAQAFQSQYPPNSLPTDITLSQFLSIQEKGVSAWSFDPDYESSPNVLVHARTELTFLPDPSSASSVQSNLPLPKLNEVYYWEVKMFDLPAGTNVSIGLATKPYPTFRLPGHCRFSVAYHSNGDKSYHFPFTATSYGPTLKEGDVLGVGYRPRSGSIFFTRNGRKMDDAFIGLNRWNLFPTVGADGPCSVHVNLGQAGFVHIEANVKKWGLAPSVGTLAPPPAYGSERGSILLEAGGMPGAPPVNSATRPGPRVHTVRTAEAGTSASGHATPTRRSHRVSRRARQSAAAASSVPSASSPLRSDPITSAPDGRPTITNVMPSDRYISPTDSPYHAPPTNPRLPPPSDSDRESVESAHSPYASASSSSSSSHPDYPEGEETPLIRVAEAPNEDSEDSQGSPLPPNPPTPHVADIHLRLLNPHSRGSSIHTTSSSIHASPRRSTSAHSRSNSHPPSISNIPPLSSLPAHLRPPTDSAPPAYSPLDAYAYPDGVAIDLPADIIAAALGGGSAAPERRTGG
ncbi:Rsp5p-dependent ubiquitination, sorting of cargo proteins at the multivesicular body [Tulasnella sp. 403]|nr:Rsp5p-dependent ubiquitination, sorting of cargo proteins at the multivesicular body [Tulasnella sp. 403]